MVKNRNEIIFHNLVKLGEPKCWTTVYEAEDIIDIMSNWPNKMLLINGKEKTFQKVEEP